MLLPASFGLIELRSSDFSFRLDARQRQSRSRRLPLLRQAHKAPIEGDIFLHVLELQAAISRIVIVDSADPKTFTRSADPQEISQALRPAHHVSEPFDSLHYDADSRRTSLMVVKIINARTITRPVLIPHFWTVWETGRPRDASIA